MEIIRPSDLRITIDELKRRVKEAEERVRSELSDFDADYLIGYVNGLSYTFAFNGGEPTDESKLEYLLMKGIMLENINKLKEMAEERKKGLLRFLGVE